MPAGPILAASRQSASRHWYEKGLSRSDCKTDHGIKTRDVSYFKVDGKISVGVKGRVPTDMPHARSEITRLGHCSYDRFIESENNGTLELMQFAHRDADDWYSDVPIDSRRGDWKGFVRGCRADTESALNTEDCSLRNVPGLTRSRLQCAERQAGKSGRDRALVNVAACKRHQEKHIKYSTVLINMPTILQRGEIMEFQHKTSTKFGGGTLHVTNRALAFEIKKKGTPFHMLRNRMASIKTSGPRKTKLLWTAGASLFDFEFKTGGAENIARPIIENTTIADTGATGATAYGTAGMKVRITAVGTIPRIGTRSGRGD